MNVQSSFWQYLGQLVATSRIVIDRPKDTPHPHFPERIYPLDYGYLEGTTTVDGGGLDIWSGSMLSTELVGVICTVDLFKRDAEIKLMLGCTESDICIVMAFLNDGPMRAIYLPRPV